MTWKTCLKTYKISLIVRNTEVLLFTSPKKQLENLAILKFTYME